MRKFLVIMAPLGVILLGILGVVLLHATKPEPKKDDEIKQLAASLYVEPARREPVTLTIETQGTVASKNEIDLIPQISGRIDSVSHAFAAGGTFKKGDVLLEIDDANYRFAVTEAEAQVAAAALALAQEEARAEMARRQWQWDEVEKNNEKPTPLALKVPHVEDARARLAGARAQLDRARLDLSRTRLTAPFDGRVREKAADIGQFVTAGTRLGRVFSTEVVEVRLPFTDQQLAELDLPIAYSAARYEDAPRVTLHARLAGEQRNWQGRIVRTDAAIDNQTRLFHAIVEVIDPYGSGSDQGVPLPVGLFVEASVEGRKLANALVIPRAALRGANSVYALDGENRLVVRTVTVLSSNADRVVLADGIEEGERVIVSPVRSVREGMLVDPLSRDDTAALAASFQ